MHLHKVARGCCFPAKDVVDGAACQAGMSATPQPLLWTGAFLRCELRPPLVVVGQLSLSFGMLVATPSPSVWGKDPGLYKRRGSCPEQMIRTSWRTPG
jgi:hypothetical protein